MGEAFVDDLNGAKTEEAAKSRSAHGRTTSAARALPKVISDATGDLAESLAFEHLVASLSSQFVELPAEKLDARIDDAVAAFGQFADVGRCAVILFSSRDPQFQVAHLWASEDFDPDVRAVPVTLKSEAPWFTGTLLSAEPVIFTSADQMPEEATFERTYAREIDIRSSAFVPLVVDDAVIGCFGVDMLGRERQWTDMDVERIKVIGRLIGGAVRRRHHAKEVANSLRFEQALTNVSARLAAIKPKAVDDEIVVGLACIGECLGTDLGTVLQFDESEPRVLRVSHEWDSEEIDVDQGFVGERVTAADGWPWLAKVLPEGRPVLISSLDDFPADAALERAACESIGIKSVLWVPVHVQSDLRGYIAFNTFFVETQWTPETAARLQLVGELLFNALYRAKAWRSLQESEQQCRVTNRQLKRLKKRLQRENAYLRDAVRVQLSFDEIVGNSEALKAALARVEQVAPHDSTVLIHGETGTGKELLARALHKNSTRGDRTLVTVNCAALPATLMEAELFGREKGAYTGAMSRQAGRFELADGSSIFLDEIGELSLELQANLLRILQSGEFERLGSTRTRKVDVRVVAATNRDLRADIEAGRFREDLFYRLNVFPIHVPPLRERVDDIPLLVWAFIREFEETMGKRIETLAAEAIDTLQNYDWPGNVRELRNAIERAMIVTQGPVLQLDLPRTVTDKPIIAAGSSGKPSRSLAAVERIHIREVLESTQWRVRGDGGAAEILGLKPSTLEWRMKKLKISRPG